MAKEYIEREVALMGVMRAGCMANTVQVLKDIPADDVVEVVRCKDCVYSKNYTCTRGEMYDDTMYSPDYFCADGERRDNNGNEETL